MRSKGYVSAVVESGSLASENRPLASRGLTGRGPGGGGGSQSRKFPALFLTETGKHGGLGS